MHELEYSQRRSYYAFVGEGFVAEKKTQVHFMLLTRCSVETNLFNSAEPFIGSAMEMRCIDKKRESWIDTRASH